MKNHLVGAELFHAYGRAFRIVKEPIKMEP